ncbi:MAG: Formyltetrahydrofolate deformylase [Actinomycetota bacterium]|jgi:formyltetrahydrofolate deformylase
MASVILGFSCPDQPGIVHSVSSFIVTVGGNITESQQFEDRDTRLFFMRVEFDVPDTSDVAGVKAAFAPVASRFGMQWNLVESNRHSRLLIMVSKYEHCLNDLLFRHRSNSLAVDIPLIVSNHRDLEEMAAWYGIPFEYVPATDKSAAETRLREIVSEHEIDFVVLARYMQILSDEFCKDFSGRIINIHHSFLPSFKGARPYHQAHERGVKLIGATAHYVTSDLDEGPIIEQEVARVDHADSPDALAAVGRDVEARALAKAVGWHAEHRVFLSGSRTIVFK